jgi:hypothetical protein
MRFTTKIPGGATTANPRTAPADIPPNAILRSNAALSNTGTADRRTMFALEGVTAQTATVQVWVKDTTESYGYVDPGGKENPPNDEWYELGAVVALTVGETAFGEPIPEGQFYVQVTVASAAASVIKLGPAP